MDQQQHSNWKCPQCGLNDIGGDRIKCPRCGKKRNRWGYWDCASCQTKGIRADHKECPGCGRPRERKVKFYLRDDLIEFVDEVSGNDAVRIRRPNWICPYCLQQNDDALQVCPYCGANRAESTEKYHDVKNEPEPPPVPTYTPQKKKKKKNGCLFAAIVMGIFWGIMFIIAGISVAFENASSKKIRTADLTDAYWECNVYLEDLKTFEGNDWELPADARLLRTATEQYEYVDHYERRSREVWINDDDDDDWGGNDWDDGGWEDYGDGQFGVFQMPFPLTFCTVQPGAVLMRYETEYYDEPVYASEPRTKYYYEYDRWVDGRLLTTSGKPGTEPYYESYTLRDEKERERGRTTDYYIIFNHKNHPVKLTVAKEVFDAVIAEGRLTYRCDISENKKNNPDYYIITGGQEYLCREHSDDGNEPDEFDLTDSEA